MTDSERSPREKTLEPVAEGKLPNSRASLVAMGGTPTKGGRPRNEHRERARSMLDDNLDLFEKLLQKDRERLDSGEDVDHKRVCDISDRLYKIAGLDVQRIAQTNADGEDAAPALNERMLDAIISARQAQLAPPIVVIDPTKVATVRVNDGE